MCATFQTNSFYNCDLGLVRHQFPSHGPCHEKDAKLAVSHNQFQRLQKQYMVFKLLQHFPPINYGAVTAFHTETSSFSHPFITTFPLPSCPHTMPSHLPASSLFHSFCPLRRFAMMRGSFGEQQELSSEPSPPFKLQECPTGQCPSADHTAQSEEWGAAFSRME